MSVTVLYLEKLQRLRSSLRESALEFIGADGKKRVTVIVFKNWRRRMHIGDEAHEF